ncbi:MAG: GAF domain-containing SpoIIE family protein phosphatase [Candidatus Hydrogenedentota bacterium]
MTNNETLKRYREIVDKIYEMISLTASISVSFNLQEILANVLKLSEEIMEADASSFMLLDEERQELYFEVARGEVADELKNKFRLKVGQGISGWVAENGEPLLIEDAYKDPRFHRKFDDETGFRTKCIMCVPLKAKNKVIGTGQVINKRGDRIFDKEDLQMFTAFCNLVAVAIENARLHKVEIEKDRVIRELEFGKEIQQSFLPKSFPESNLFNIYAYNKTALEVGGDLYDVFNLANGEICFVIGDVSGKGVSAALFMARFISDLRHMASHYSSPDKLLNALNEILCPRSHRGMFITSVIGFINPLNGDISIANAGHCAVMLLDKIKKEVIEICEASGPPLGIVEYANYESRNITIQERSLLLMYSDGISEASNYKEELFGVKRLKDVLIKNIDKNGEELINNILKSIDDFCKGTKQKDDITLLIVEKKNG